MSYPNHYLGVERTVIKIAQVNWGRALRVETKRIKSFDTQGEQAIKLMSQTRRLSVIRRLTGSLNTGVSSSRLILVNFVWRFSDAILFGGVRHPCTWTLVFYTGFFAVRYDFQNQRALLLISGGLFSLFFTVKSLSCFMFQLMLKCC